MLSGVALAALGALAAAGCGGSSNLPGELFPLSPAAPASPLAEAALRKARDAGAAPAAPPEAHRTDDSDAAFGTSDLSTMPATAGHAVVATTDPAAAASPLSSEKRTRLAALLKQARQDRLFADEGWLGLLHYRRVWGTGTWRSEADGKEFFLAGNGQRSPVNELEATLRAFYAPPSSRPGEPHALCQFPARRRFLEQHLPLADLPVPACPLLDEFRRELSAAAITLVFAAEDATSPSNAFGHTFLRVHSSRPGPAEDRELIDAAIDFGPRQGEGPDNRVLHGLSSFAGLLPGEFRSLPYYYKVREAQDGDQPFDARDMWSYRLALSDEEVANFVDHLWELGATWFYYDTLRENGAYQIANAIGAAIPRLRTAPRLHWPVLPADTLKQLTELPGAVASITYQPAPRRQLRRAVADFSDDERAAVRQLALDPTTPLPAAWPARRLLRVLEAAVLQVDVTLAATLPFDAEGEGARRKQRLLERRTALTLVDESLEAGAKGAPFEQLVSAEQLPRGGLGSALWQRPHTGHGSRRLGLFGGAVGGTAAISIDARLSMHDLADPAPGYPQTSALELFAVRARLFFEEDEARVVLDHAFLVRAALLTPWDVRHRLSVRFQVGALNVDDAGCSRSDCLAAHALAGTGLAFASERRRWLGWIMLDGQLTSGPHLQGPGGVPLRLGAAPSAGLRLRLHDDLSAIASTSLWLLPWQTPSARSESGFELRWLLSRPVALAAEARLDHDVDSGQTRARAQFGAYLYF